MIEPRQGMFCESRQGRDKGRYFMICNILDERYVEIVDGTMRRIERPKRKKLKHLRLTPEISPIGEKFLSGAKVFDAEVKSAVSGYKLKKEGEQLVEE